MQLLALRHKILRAVVAMTLFPPQVLGELRDNSLQVAVLLSEPVQLLGGGLGGIGAGALGLEGTLLSEVVVLEGGHGLGEGGLRDDGFLDGGVVEGQ